MPTHFEYAVHSLSVYNDPAVIIPPMPNWQTFRTSDTDGLTTNGYFGTAYINIHSNPKQLVIAHRGTDTLPDIYSDAQLFLEKIPKQFIENATPFSDRVKAALGSSLSEYALSYTGHSLGAALAELSAASDNVVGVTFESPGTLPIINNMISRGELPANALANANNNIITYNAGPNIVNTLNNHVGKLSRVFPPLNSAISGDATSGISYLEYAANQHSMIGVLAQYNPETGLPKIISERDSWPVGTNTGTSGYNSYKSYSENPYFWNQYFTHQNLSPAFQQGYIYANLGGYGTPTAAGITINADHTKGDVWGATTRSDRIINNGGDRTLYGYQGQDTYDIRVNSLGIIGKSRIIDSDNDGIISITGSKFSGVANAVSNRPEGSTYTHNRNDGTTWVETKRDAIGGAGSTDSDLEIRHLNDNGDNTVTVKDFANGQFGIALAQQQETKPFLITPTIKKVSDSCRLANDNVVTVFRRNRDSASGIEDIYGQLSSPSGTLIGNMFTVKALGAAGLDLQQVSVAPTNEGGFAVSWATTSTNQGLHTAIFDASANKLREVDIRSAPTVNPDQALQSDGKLLNIYQTETGALQGITMNTATYTLGTPYTLSTDFAFRANILVHSNGNIITAWDQIQGNINPNTAYNNPVKARIGRSDGSVISTFPVGTGCCPEIAELSDGTLAVSIQLPDSSIGSQSQVKFYSSSGTPVGTPYTSRGFITKMVGVQNKNFVGGKLLYDAAGGYTQASLQEYSTIGEVGDSLPVAQAKIGGTIQSLIKYANGRVLLNYLTESTSLYGTIASADDTGVKAATSSIIGANLLPDDQGNIASGSGVTTLNGGPGKTTFKIGNTPGARVTIRGFETDKDKFDLSAFPDIDSYNKVQINTDNGAPSFGRRLLQALPISTAQNVMLPNNITVALPHTGGLSNTNFDGAAGQLPSSGGSGINTNIIIGSVGGTVLLAGIVLGILKRGPIARGIRKLFGCTPPAGQEVANGNAHHPVLDLEMQRLAEGSVATEPVVGNTSAVTPPPLPPRPVGNRPVAAASDATNVIPLPVAPRPSTPERRQLIESAAQGGFTQAAHQRKRSGSFAEEVQEQQAQKNNVSRGK